MGFFISRGSAMSVKAALVSRDAIVAYIGAAAVIIAAYIGYRLGEKQYSLEHDKWIVDLIFKIVPLGSDTKPKSTDVIRVLARSKALRDDAAMICRTFGVGPPDCPPLPQ
jgi:hypothetical protein